MIAYLCDPRKNTSCRMCGTIFCATKDIASCEWTTKKKYAWIDPRTERPHMIDIVSENEDGVNGHISITALARQAAAETCTVVIGTEGALRPNWAVDMVEDEETPLWTIANPAIKGLRDGQM